MEIHYFGYYKYDFPFVVFSLFVIGSAKIVFM